MNKRLFINLWHLKLFFLLKLFVGPSNAVNMTALKLVCSIDSGRKEVSTLKDTCCCTAIAAANANPNTGQGDIKSLRGNLPYVFIYNKAEYKKMKSRMKSENMDNFINEINDLLTTNRIEVMLFDNFAPDKKKDVNDDLQKNMQTFFKKLKEQHPQKLFGLVIPKDEDILKNAFQLDVIDDTIDVYLVKTLNYHKCWIHYHETNMKNTAPLGEIEKTLTMLVRRKYKLNKFLLDIRVVVNNVKYDKSAEKNDVSYATHCAADPPQENPKCCLESLTGYYSKATLVNSYKMAGAYFQSLDRDDYNDSCTCGKYAVLQVINAGIQGHPPPPLTKCKNWALFPKDRSKMPQPPDDDGPDGELDDGDDSADENPVTPQSLAPGGDDSSNSE